MAATGQNFPGASRVVITDYAAAMDAVLATVAAARHRLRIYAPALDPRLFGGSALAVALGELATRHARNRIRVLVEDPASILQSVPRVLALVRRLPSFVAARRTGESQVAPLEMFVLADRSAYVHQPRMDQLRAFADLADGRTTSQLTRRFDALWDASEPIAGIQTLGL